MTWKHLENSLSCNVFTHKLGATIRKFWSTHGIKESEKDALLSWAFCTEELTLWWVLWHGSYFVLGPSLEIASQHDCFLFCSHWRRLKLWMVSLILCKNSMLAEGPTIKLLVADLVCLCF